ncbi:MAG: competence type IV pilus minor pilin ComGG [Vagococcus sp.]
MKKYISTLCHVRKNEGGILIPVLAILVMMTTLVLFFIQDGYMRQEFTKQTTDFYLARTLENMAIEEVSQQKVIQNQQIDYNIGIVKIIKKDNSSKITVETCLNNQYKRTKERTLSFKE